MRIGNVDAIRASAVPMRGKHGEETAWLGTEHVKPGERPTLGNTGTAKRYDITFKTLIGQRCLTFTNRTCTKDYL